MLHRAVVVSLFSRRGCCGVVRRLRLDGRLVALSLATSSLLLRRVCRVVFCACGVGGSPPEVLVFWRVVGGWRLRRSPFPWAFWGSCSLGMGEALFLCLWVCF